MKKVVCIVGPTGSGKSDISLKLAHDFDNEIINGDSVQVYKYLDIGSAKLKDFQGIKHHLIDFLEPNMEYSVCDFQRNVREWIDKIDRPMIVGGTGLYIKAALYNYEFDGSKRDFSFEEKYKDKETEELYNWLLSLDENTSVDKNNRVRIFRSLEMALSNNYLSKRQKKDEPLYDVLLICLNAEREILYQRINSRVLKMIDEGLVKEVKDLRERNIVPKGIGYNEINKYLDNELSLSEATLLIQKNTRHYAKRQLTWYRHQMDAMIFDIGSPYEEIFKIVDDFYRLSYRFSTPNDQCEIMALYSEILPSMIKYGWQEIKQNDIHQGVVALYDENIVGYIDINGYFLSRIMVKDEFRNKKIGKGMFNFLFNERKGIYNLLVHKNNNQAIAFYERLGFSINEEKDCFFLIQKEVE